MIQAAIQIWYYGCYKSNLFFNQSKNIKNIFTKVLNHIAVATTNINKDNIGKKIDIRARKFLKK